MLLPVTLLTTAFALTGCLVPQGNLSPSWKLSRTEQLPTTPTLNGIVFGPDPANKLDVYVAKPPSKGTIIFFHGGGWLAGNEKSLSPFVMTQVKRGWNVVSVGYRLASPPTNESQGITIPEILQDADLATRFVMFRAAELQINVSKVVVAGSSAGGHIALMLASAPSQFKSPSLPDELASIETQIDGVVSLAGVSDLSNFSTYGFFRPEAVEVALGCEREAVPLFQLTSACSLDYLREMSPLYWVNDAVAKGRPLPPAYLGYGKLDTIVQFHTQGQRLERLWSEVTGTNKVWLDAPPLSGHNVDYFLNKKWFDLWFDLLASDRL